MSANAPILEQLLDLHRREAEAIAQIDVEALGSIESERGALLGRLTTASPDDRPLVLQVEAARARNERAAEQQLHIIGQRINKLGQGKLALRGYTPGGAERPTARFFDEGA
jgi:hypothetical protein